MSNTTEVHLSRVKLNSTGYDASGTYYGIGAKLWNAGLPNDSFRFRCNDLQSARAYMRQFCENRFKTEAKFIR